MKKILLLLIVWAMPFVLLAQTDRKVDSNGVFQYQYSRTYAVNPDNESEMLVTFVFVNGAQPRAISLRQEVLESVVLWLEIPGGAAGHETVVEFVTANLEAGETVTWKYAISTRKGSCPLIPEQAALLVMHENYGVEKVWLK